MTSENTTGQEIDFREQARIMNLPQAYSFYRHLPEKPPKWHSFYDPLRIPTSYLSSLHFLGKIYAKVKDSDQSPNKEFNPMFEYPNASEKGCISLKHFSEVEAKTVTEIENNMWKLRVKRLREHEHKITDVVVPECPFPVEYLFENGHMVAYLPPEFSTIKGLDMLSDALGFVGPDFENADKYLENTNNFSGWFAWKAQTSEYASESHEFSDKTVSELKAMFDNKHVHEMTLNQYILAGDCNHILTRNLEGHGIYASHGFYLDGEGRWTRLLGTTVDGNPIAARFWHRSDQSMKGQLELHYWSDKKQSDIAKVGYLHGRYVMYPASYPNSASPIK